MTHPLGLTIPTPASPLELAEIIAQHEDRANAETMPPADVDLDEPFLEASGEVDTLRF